MSRVHSQPQPVGVARIPRTVPALPRTLRVLAAALASLIAGGLLASPISAASLAASPASAQHRAKTLKTLPTIRATKQTAGAGSASSPYAHAAAERAASGQPPPGHAQVLRRTAPNLAPKPAP